MTEEEEQEWRERLKAAVEKTLRTRAEKKAERADHLRRRKYGKAAYHRSKLARPKEKKTMTDTTTTTTEANPWMPVLVFHRDDENCAVCGDGLDENYLASIAVGVNKGGSACKDCVESLGAPGEGLWELAQALNSMDTAIWKLPQALRASMTQVATDMLQKILEWRRGPVTPEEKTAFVAEMAAHDKFLSLPGGLAVKAAEYDPEKHGPFLP